MCAYSRQSGRFWQAQGVEEVKLLPCGFAGAVEGAISDMGGVPLDAGEIETALTVTRASRLTTWATLSTSGLKGVILPPPPSGEVVILCADNDDAGLAAAKITAARLEDEGHVVSVIHPQSAGADFNDVLRGAV